MKEFIFVLLLFFSFLYGEVLLPQGDEAGEPLDIRGKIREYYLLDNNLYKVSGPSIVTIYARLAVPKKEKGVKTFTIKSFIHKS